MRVYQSRAAPSSEVGMSGRGWKMMAKRPRGMGIKGEEELGNGAQMNGQLCTYVRHANLMLFFIDAYSKVVQRSLIRNQEEL